MLIEWYAICAKVKYVVSCLCWLVSITSFLYQCEYEMSWLRILKPLCLELMNDIRPWMTLRRSFMWNLEPSGTVMNIEVENLNGILLVMNDGHHHIFLRKVIMTYFFCHCKAALGDIFCRVNVIGWWTWYRTPFVWTFNCKLLYENKG